MAHVLQPTSATVDTELLVVIVNYRTASLVADCLASLQPEVESLRTDGICARVALVDGGSRDGSAEQLSQLIEECRYARWVELLALPDNRGFAAGNNAAIKRALNGPDRPEYIYLLNPDTVIRPGALRTLLAFMRAHKAAGIAGSRCENPDGSPRQSAFRFPSILGELESEAAFRPISRLLETSQIAMPVSPSTHRADWVCGAAMMVRTSLFERIGLFDEDYFLYYEETDLALRAASAGYECWYVPASRIVHYCGQASGITGAEAPKNRVPEYWYASRKRYFEKHHGPAYAMLADAAWLAGSVSRRCRRSLLHQSSQDPPHQLEDFVRFSAERWMAS